MLEIKNLMKAFEKNTVLDGVSVDIQQGEIVALLGPSGSGKSTFLKCINGLVKPDGGEVFYHGKPILNKGQVGMIFQHFNLFPHLSVVENITLAPRLVQGKGQKMVKEEAIELLKKVQLADKADSYPAELSGGQKQRVAIARALAMNPSLLLLDEVTSALDPELVEEVLLIIEELARSNMTLLIVTHEIGFAKKLANRILFFDSGKILEDRPVNEFFNRPETERAKEFLSRVYS